MAKHVEKEFPVDIHAVPHLKDYVDDVLQEWQINEEIRRDVVLACDEAATNIVMHAYKGKQTSGEHIKVMLRSRSGVLEILFEDHGRSFDVESLPTPNIKLNLSGQKRGGFGIYLMKKLMDRIKYRARNGCNVTCLLKRVAE